MDGRSCCLHFTSHRSGSQILVKNRDFLPTLRAYIRRRRQRSPRRNIVIAFGTEKLEWWGYPMMKNF